MEVRPWECRQKPLQCPPETYYRCQHQEAVTMKPLARHRWGKSLCGGDNEAFIRWTSLITDIIPQQNNQSTRPRLTVLCSRPRPPRAMRLVAYGSVLDKFVSIFGRQPPFTRDLSIPPSRWLEFSKFFGQFRGPVRGCAYITFTSCRS